MHHQLPSLKIAFPTTGLIIEQDLCPILAVVDHCNKSSSKWLSFLSQGWSWNSEASVPLSWLPALGRNMQQESESVQGKNMKEMWVDAETRDHKIAWPKGQMVV